MSRVRKLAAASDLDVTATRADVTELDAVEEFDLVSVCYMHLPADDRAKMLARSARAVKLGGRLLFRSFEASIEEAPFDRHLLPSRKAVLAELGAELTVERADVAAEYFPYMKREMTLLTVVAIRCLPSAP